MSIEQKHLFRVLQAEFTELGNLELTGHTPLSEIIGNSSLNLLFLRGIIQEHFGAVLTDEQIKSCHTLDHLVTLIGNHAG